MARELLNIPSTALDIEGVPLDCSSGADMAFHRSDARSQDLVTRILESRIWCALRKQDMELVLESAITRSYSKGERIFDQGDVSDGVHLVFEGLVNICKSGANGRMTMLRLARPGDMIGYRSLMADTTHATRAEVLVRTVTCFLERSLVECLIERNAELRMNFLSVAATDLGEAEDRFHLSVTEEVGPRLVRLLDDLKERFGGVRDDGHVTLEIPLTREGLAAMLGVRRESVSRVIHDLSEEGLVQRSGRRIKIQDA